MEIKEIIIRLISEDMKYHRLTNALYKNEPIPNEYDMDLLTVVAQLMGIKKGLLKDEWIDCYMQKMNIEYSKVDALSLAEEAYVSLQEIRTT